MFACSSWLEGFHRRWHPHLQANSVPSPSTAMAPVLLFVQNELKEGTEGVLGCIGNTPLIKIRSLSEATGCEILAKAEFLNPGGSIKDRIALHMVQKAAASGRLLAGAVITEATAGSTGVSLAMVAAASGHRYSTLCQGALQVTTTTF